MPAAQPAVPQDTLQAAVDATCARIAPTWPLDQFIAVNPLWGFIGEALPAVSARVAALSGSRLLMPRAWYRAQWHAGHLQRQHLQAAIEQAGAECSVAQLVALLEAPEPAAPPRALVSDLLDADGDTLHRPSWGDFIAHGISQFCAAWFDEGQAQLGPDRSGGLFAGWLRHAEQDLSPALLMGFKGWRMAVRTLPRDPQLLIAHAVDTLRVPAAEHEAYFTALLLRLNGWSSWCAYRRWQARLGGSDDDQIVQLLAVRLAWELLLHMHAGGSGLATRWYGAMAQWPAVDARAATAQQFDWLLQTAMEIAYQAPLCEGLARMAGAPPSEDAPRLQAAFCIDVRSETFRRALESASAEIRTLGFAGFFGLPVEYRPLGAIAARPQLPGLLAPQMQVRDAAVPIDLAARRAGRLRTSRSWTRFRTGAVSGFSFVESVGLMYAGKLLGNTLRRSRPVAQPESAGLTPAEHAARKPRLATYASGETLPLPARVDLAAGILRAMSLSHGFARLILLAGHGSETVNNPHAAGLDCGACCGQTGEVNARATAALLNDRQVREGLRGRGIDVPPTTHFLAGLHNTTTDAVLLFDLDELPETHTADLEALKLALASAGERARAERAGALGLRVVGADRVRGEVEARADDWSQVRPEWGLANNAAFIVAPREHCKGLNLQGRSFLHDYRWQEDEGFAVLELIMTAPMVVTHWINFQYYTSTVDNVRFGSGNKVLHNVVGGHLGVFEGNGGDLRIGLPMQSLHDGTRWVHTPLRLSVFIEAPADAIARVLAKHAHVRQLVENEWLHLFQIEAAAGAVNAYVKGAWKRRSLTRA
jgi:uncharacterized protein YbcC (UPF0753/DUF2309 family)